LVEGHMSNLGKQR